MENCVQGGPCPRKFNQTGKRRTSLGWRPAWRSPPTRNGALFFNAATKKRKNRRNAERKQNESAHKKATTESWDKPDSFSPSSSELTTRYTICRKLVIPDTWSTRFEARVQELMSENKTAEAMFQNERKRKGWKETWKNSIPSLDQAFGNQGIRSLIPKAITCLSFNRKKILSIPRLWLDGLSMTRSNSVASIRRLEKMRFPPCAWIWSKSSIS